jgi:hypothetical protein
MPLLPTASPTEIIRRYVPLTLPTDNIRRYYTESWNKITSHAIITDGLSVGNAVGTFKGNYRRIYSVGNVPAGNFFLARAYPSILPSVFPSVGGFFYLRRKWDLPTTVILMEVFRRYYFH